ncbi:T9SS type A sorting domain-containing protein [Gaetbulibacter jejuensis]|uniref:T9SS type A sorting domain-containing protein n=1 Tax=Gaetbulibacter jejuensis TaxID=584607 RepID=UPI003007F5B7
MKPLNFGCHNYGLLCFKKALCLILFVSYYSIAQVYPPDVNVNSVDWGTYQVPTSVPDYLATFTDPLTGNNVTRISDENVFGCDCSQLRHIYAKKQPWNADGTKIMTAGWPSKILDGNTYEVLTTAYCRSLWSNVEPDITYDSHENQLFRRNIVTQNETVLKTFSGYSSVSVGDGEGNLSNDDRYVALIATSGSQKTILVYDIFNDEILGTKSLGTANIDWVSVSQSGEYVVMSGYSDGSGPLQGIKAYDKYMNNEIHLYSGRPHGDIGYDAQGNEVYVAYQGVSGYSLSYARLDNGAKQGIFPFSGGSGDSGLWGGHISTRNLNRPGWAYVSEQGHPSNVNNYEATREIFAIKLDNSQTIERFTKHNTNLNSGYSHQAHAVPNRDGSKVIFASNWDNASLENNSYPLLWVVEAPQDPTGITANAGEDISICEGEEVVLTASGGATYEWSTGETTQSITVSPTETTVYTVTVFDESGSNSDQDDVTVTVNALPVANAGEDVSVCFGDSITLTASGGSTYLWSTGETTQSITVSPGETTIYSVEVFENNCSSTDEVMVTVNELPIVDAGSNVTISLGESATLTVTGADTYLWSTGETTQSITVSPSETTTYSVTGFTNGCENTNTVTVFLQGSTVVADAGEDVSICEGEEVVLIATGGATYEWSTGETTQSITVSPAETTIYTVTVFDESGSNSDQDDVTVTVNAHPIANAGEDVSVCLGNSITLTASGGSTYLWSTGETTESITVSPSETTTYSVEVFENSCSSTDQVMVTINELPIVDAGPNVAINVGESTTLTATGADTYLWSTGETTQSITVSPVETTTYSVTGFTNGCEASDSVLVSVEDLVIANAGDDVSICQGHETVLTASGGESYLWSTGATTQSITVSPSSTSTYSVVAYVGDQQDEDEVTVTVNPNPNVIIQNGDEVMILQGDYITLSATGANSYQWSNGATQPNIAVNPGVTTTYSVTGFINNCEDEKQITVNVLEEVTAVVDVEQNEICLGETVTLTASGGDEYLWSTGDTTESITVSPEESLEYSVTVFNALDFDETSVIVSVVDCSSIETPDEPEEFDFLVYQDPQTDVLKVRVSGYQSVNVNNMSIFDITGKHVFSIDFEEEDESIVEKEIDTSSFSRGIYIIRLVYDDKALVKKIPIR